MLFAQHPTRAEQTSRRCFSGPPPPTQPQLLQVLANAHTCALHGKLALGGGEAWDVVATPQPLAFCKKLPLWGQLSPGGPHGVRLRLDVFLPLPAPPHCRQLSVVRRALPQGAPCARTSLRPTTALSSAFSLYKVMGLKGPSGTSLALRFSAVSSTLEALQAAMTVLCCDGRRPCAWEGAGVGTCVWMPLF